MLVHMFILCVNSACWVILHAFLWSADFFSNQLFRKILSEYHLNIKRIGSRSGPTFCWVLSGSSLFAYHLFEKFFHKYRQYLKYLERALALHHTIIGINGEYVNLHWKMFTCPQAEALINMSRQELFSEPYQCQTVWIQIRPEILSGLIWVQTVSKGYLQTTRVGKELKKGLLYNSMHRLKFSGYLNSGF